MEIEQRSTLALMAARHSETSIDSGTVSGDSDNGESYMERYTKGISAVESILMLDRLRQEVHLLSIQHY